MAQKHVIVPKSIQAFKPDFFLDDCGQEGNTLNSLFPCREESTMRSSKKVPIVCCILCWKLCASGPLGAILPTLA
jgi:hypothetical protein